MARGLYTVAFTEQSITNANGDYDLWEIDPAADKPVEIAGIFINNKSEVGDVQEEMVSFSIWYASGGTFTSSNGTSATPRPTDPSDGAASFAAETVGASVATTTGTLVHKHYGTFNIRVGLEWFIPPEFRIKCDGAANSAIGVRLLTALTDDATLSGTLYVREL